jgi:hypothetical protein
MLSVELGFPSCRAGLPVPSRFCSLLLTLSFSTARCLCRLLLFGHQRLLTLLP